MTTEQFAQLLTLLEKIASRQYTITGASDWPILLVIGGITFALIGAMWTDLRNNFREQKAEAKEERNLIWSALKDCQDDCCPRTKKDH